MGGSTGKRSFSSTTWAWCAAEASADAPCTCAHARHMRDPRYARCASCALADLLLHAAVCYRSPADHLFLADFHPPPPSAGPFAHLQMLEQVAAVVPISILLVTVMGIFFGASVEVGCPERVLAFNLLAMAV